MTECVEYRVHELKTDPKPFQAIADGKKRCEIRFNDRDFQEQDILHLKETQFSGEEMKTDTSRNYRGLPPIEGKPLVYTGREIFARVTHVLESYGVKTGWVVMSIEVIDEIGI